MNSEYVQGGNARRQNAETSGDLNTRGPSNPFTRQQRNVIIAQVLRHDYLVPLHLMFAHNLSDLAQRASISGVEDALAACPAGTTRELKIFSGQSSSTPHRSADWYVNKTLSLQEEVLGASRDVGYGPQIYTGATGKLLMQDPFQLDNPHWDVLVVNQDLWDGPDTNWVFGVTNQEFPYSIQSVARFTRSIIDDDAQFFAIRRILRHEVGHMLGLPNEGRKANLVDSLGIHCTSQGCSMRQGLSLDEWLSHAREEDVAANKKNGSYVSAVKSAHLPQL